MAKKTVSNRITKGIIRSSDDGALFNDDDARDTVSNAVTNLNASKEHAKSNAEIIQFEETPVVETQEENKSAVSTQRELTEKEKEEIAQEEMEEARKQQSQLNFK